MNSILDTKIVFKRTTMTQIPAIDVFTRKYLNKTLIDIKKEINNVNVIDDIEKSIKMS